MSYDKVNTAGYNSRGNSESKMLTRVGFATITDLPVVKVYGTTLGLHVFIKAQRR